MSMKHEVTFFPRYTLFAEFRGGKGGDREKWEGRESGERRKRNRGWNSQKKEIKIEYDRGLERGRGAKKFEQRKRGN
jgi:hypothetical protein